MPNRYDIIGLPNKGAWVVHHGQKTAAAVNASAEFSAIDTAGKAASLLSQLAASDETTSTQPRVKALAKAAGLNPAIELPALLDLLKRKRVIDISAAGDVAVLGVTSRATVQYAAEIFEEQEPTPEEKASIVLAEFSSDAPAPHDRAAEFISDEFKLSSIATLEFLQRAEMVGFVDAEGSLNDKLYFNGNLFRRDNLNKTNNVLSSISTAEKAKVIELDQELNHAGCVSLAEGERTLGKPLFEKLRAAGMYDVNIVANPAGEYGFITKPAAFHKFNDPLVDDAFDLAKALVAALSYGMTQSAPSRGKIAMLSRLLGKLIGGGQVGPATAIGEDYRILETKGVIRVTKARPYGFTMRLLKRDIGEMALQVLTVGETASTSTLDRPLPGQMTSYSGPEKTRTEFRQKTQTPQSKRSMQDVLDVLRTKGNI